jgi:hypothetical protein
LVVVSVAVRRGGKRISVNPLDAQRARGFTESVKSCAERQKKCIVKDRELSSQ